MNLNIEYKMEYSLLALSCFTFLLIGVNTQIPSDYMDPVTGKYLLECHQEIGIDLTNVQTIDVAKLKCLAKCIAIKKGFMKDDGEIIAEEATKLFNPDNDKEIEKDIAQCLVIEDVDLCEKAFDIETCLIENGKFTFGPNKKLIPSMRKCMKELSISVIKQGNEDIDKDTKCLSACVAEKNDWINDNGDIIKENIIKDLSLDESDVEIQKCFDQNLTDKCEKAWAVDNCIETRIIELSKD